MDGLSAVASGMAVASLTIQLVDSVREIQRFIRSLCSVRTELQRLIDFLDLLELILGNIGSHISHQEEYLTDANMTLSILQAMKICKGSLSKLGNVVESAKKASISKNKMAQSLGLCKLTWERKDIENYENELQLMVSTLNAAMISNLTAMQSRSNNQILTQLQTMHIQENSISCSNTMRSIGEMTDQMHIKPTISHQSSLKTTTFTTAYTYRNILGRFSSRKISQSIDSINGKPLPQKGCNKKDKTTWTFLPSFLSLCIEIQYTINCGSIQRSFRIYPQIQDNHPIWNMLFQSSVSDFYALLTSGTISPFSVNSYGSTLLHQAAWTKSFEAAKILFGLGLKGDEVDMYGRQPSQCLSIENYSIEYSKNVVHLFKSHAYQLSNGDTTEHCLFPHMFSFECGELGLEKFNYCVDECVSAQNINNFNHSLILHAFEEMHRCSDIRSRKGWRSTIKGLITMGAAVHERWQSLLDEILLLGDTEFDSAELGAEWLDILREAGVDIAQYLRIEFEIHKNSRASFYLQWNGKALCTKRLVISNSDTTQVSWDWYIDPKARAYELLNEFKCVDWFENSFYGCINPLFEIQPLFIEGYGQDVKARRLGEIRFERRQHKKAAKIAWAQGIRKGPKVPGAWIE